MEIVTLNVEERDGSGKKAAKALRNIGKMPIVMYGKEHKKFSAESKELFKVLSGPARRMVIVELVNGSSKHHSLLKELQYHPITDKLFHADFKEISLDDKITSNVPVVLNGEPEGVKLQGGTLRHHFEKLPVSALPEVMPTVLAVDVSKLAVLGSLTIKDIPLVDGAEVLADADARIASVAPRKMGPGGGEDGDAEGEEGAEAAGK